jgi:hypothetical protein
LLPGAQPLSSKPLTPAQKREDPTRIRPAAHEPTAAEICEHVELEEAAKAQIQKDFTPRQYVNRLIAKKYYQDAAKFWAYALPKREAVYWACLCVRKVEGSKALARSTAALDAAERWVLNQTDETRRAAMPAARAAGFNTPAGWTATAAFWSGGSLSPPDAPVMSPDEYLTAHAVAGALSLAAGPAESDKAVALYRQFLLLGLEVADGTKRWEEGRPGRR